jgi:membrane fusion protein, multidrug efflux system
MRGVDTLRPLNGSSLKQEFGAPPVNIPYREYLSRILLSLFAAFVILGFEACPGNAQAKSAGPPETVKAVKVQASSSASITGMGSISCPHTCELGFDDTGVVSEILAEEGEEVQKGQTLARLDASVLSAEKATSEAKLAAATAEVKFYQNELNKKEKLFEKNAVSETDLNKATLELERAKASVDLARAELATAEARLNKKNLCAPISGIISQRHVDVGSVIMPGSNKVFSLIQCRTAYAEIDLGEKMFPLAKPGMPVKIQVDALEGKVFPGKVLRVAPQIDKKNRTFVLKISVDNIGGALKPGMFARAEIAPQTDGQPVWIPKKAVMSSEDHRQYVFVVKDGVALRRQVRTGQNERERIEILNGLTIGDVVVVEGQDRISDLDEVSASISDSQRGNE